MLKIIGIMLGILVLAVACLVLIVLVDDCQHEDEENGDDKK